MFDLIDVAEEDKKLNATYIISVARKLGCSIFLLPEDIMEVGLFMSTLWQPQPQSHLYYELISCQSESSKYIVIQFYRCL